MVLLFRRRYAPRVPPCRGIPLHSPSLILVKSASGEGDAGFSVGAPFGVGERLVLAHPNDGPGGAACADY